VLPLPDRLDCVLSWAICNYELGDARPRSGDELVELVTRWDDGFLLDADERHALRVHHPLDLEWVEMVVPGFWQLLCDSENQDWGSEALHHIAELVSHRVSRVGRYGALWGEGSALSLSPDGSPRSLTGILSEGFPNSCFV